jgi:hypothetical protein
VCSRREDPVASFFEKSTRIDLEGRRSCWRRIWTRSRRIRQG